MARCPVFLDLLLSTVLLFLLLLIPKLHCYCASGLCERKSLSLNSNRKQNHSLDGYVFETLNLPTWDECFSFCLTKCQCLSFNFDEVKKTDNCELNDATTKMAPKALMKMDDVTYYEILRTYYDKDGSPIHSCPDSICHNKCCDTAPCQNGGTCREVCDVTMRRFNCTCPPGFTGHKCQFGLSRSCKDIMVSNKVTSNGNYTIVDQQNISFPVYCDFGSEPGAAWTLIQSHSLQNNDAFKEKAFYLHDVPVNQDAPEWDNYRLSKSRMKSIQDVSTHWRATCNFPTDGVDYRDYWRVSLQQLNLLVAPIRKTFCLETEYVNVNGIQCSNCTVLCGYGQPYGLHLDSSGRCDLNSGEKKNEDNFGFYGTTNQEFRCTSSQSSTTQFWLGSF